LIWDVSFIESESYRVTAFIISDIFFKQNESYNWLLVLLHKEGINKAQAVGEFIVLF
jgi:hypothetical protein